MNASRPGAQRNKDGPGTPIRTRGTHIFEALTASARPYKPGKRLSEAVDLLAGYVRQGHLDRDLFELFLRTEVHLRFARRFLEAEQVDGIDIESAIKRSI